MCPPEMQVPPPDWVYPWNELNTIAGATRRLSYCERAVENVSPGRLPRAWLGHARDVTTLQARNLPGDCYVGEVLSTLGSVSAVTSSLLLSEHISCGHCTHGLQGCI